MCISDIKSCKKCSICIHQEPLIDECTCCDGFWVGLSAKLSNTVKARPLDSSTKSGSLLDECEKSFDHIKMYRTNLVKCAPLTEQGKLRYPNEMEINSCLQNLVDEIKELRPKIVILLGKRVEMAVGSYFGIKFEADGAFSYKCVIDDGINYLSIQHPSYINIYRRAYISDYIRGISDAVKNI